MKTMTGDDAGRQHRTLTADVVRVLGGTAVVLMLPLLGMQFSKEVNWSVGDFVVIAVLLISAGLAYVAVARKVGNAWFRAAFAAVLAVAVLLIWLELAVGIFDTVVAGC